MPSKRSNGRFAIVANVIGFATVAIAAYLIWHAIIVGEVLATDFSYHLQHVRQILAGEYSTLPGHFLFHVLTAATAFLLAVSAERAAVFVMTAASLASAAIIFGLYLTPVSRRTDQLQRWALTLSALTATAIFLPMFNHLYLGQSSPNVWHNPTTALLKPFALLSAIYLDRILFERGGSRSFLIFITATIASLFAKPSFGLALAPVLLVVGAALCSPGLARAKDYFDIASNGPPVLLATALGLFALIVLQGTYIFSLSAMPAGGILVAPFYVWSRQSPFIPLSVLLAVAFPVAVTCLDWPDRLRRAGLALAWSLFGVAFFIRVLFAESGSALGYANFAWSYQITLSVLFAFSMRSYYVHTVAGHKGKGFWITTGLLFAHVMSGLYYLYQVLALGTYM